MTALQTLPNAAPFWCSAALIPLAWATAVWGGWAFLLLPVGVAVSVSLLDLIAGTSAENADPATPEAKLFWHSLITWLWPVLQGGTVFGVIGFMTASGHLTAFEMIGVAIGLGFMSGAVGIVYAHELMHQNSRGERWLGDVLMAMTLYGHFRSEHLLVHHRYVGTPRDPVTARYNESFFAFFPRVLIACFRSAWGAEATRLERSGRSRFDRKNPFWRYGGLQMGFLILAYLVGGWFGLVLFVIQAFVAIWHLELVNYIEHYGLTRKHLGDGQYEHTGPQHSWNAAHRVTNWFLINLQRHSDHHYKPDRRFPLLQTWSADEAPQLPYGYAVMGFMAMIPPLWRRRMNPRVRLWRKTFYPEIKDWQPYKYATNPMPR